ncbi:MAG: cupin domain-containing protein [Ktedonobacterales bacterium]
MRHITVADARRERERSDDLYHEFLRVPAMSAGLYALAAGAEDPQEPHTEDELYYIVSGRATILVEAEEIVVAAGSLVYVAANVAHRFHDITEALTVLVVFAPAEYSQRATGSVG